MSSASKLQAELVKTDNVGLTYISGGSPQQIRVEPDPEKLALFGVTLQQLVDKVRGANRSFQSGSVRDNDTMRNVAAGQTLAGIPDIGLLLVTTRDNRPVYVRDVADRRYRSEPAGTPSLDGDAGPRRHLEPRAGGQRRFRQARRRQCGRGGARTCWHG